MTVPDERLAAVREQGREWGAQLRSVAAAVAADDDAVRGLVDLPVYAHLATCRFGSEGPGHDEPVVRRGGHRIEATTVVEQVVLFEELARGDVGALMAAPGAPLAGPLVSMLGDPAQRERFSARLRAAPTWTFFALTEPDRGSDAGALTTALVPDGAAHRLHGAKRFVGNATRAQVGVVFARHGAGPLGLRAVVVDTADPGFSATPLRMLGLPGALVGHIELDGVAVADGDVLGAHLPAARRGTWGWMRTFALLRPRVATMAVGVALAALDRLRAAGPVPGLAHERGRRELHGHVDEVRALVRRAALAADADPGGAGPLASAAKAAAARLAEEVTLAVTDLVGPGARLDDPDLDRLVRDARCFEFMEGAGNVHRLAVGRHATRRRLHA